MTSDELLAAFRQDVVDVAKPYLWSDDEIYRYMNDAYRMFVRLTEGVPDFTSDACAVDIVPGEATATIHPSILRIVGATRRSDTHPIEIINVTDVARMRSSDYGQVKQFILDSTPGQVRYMVLGMQKGVVRWAQVPEVEDVCDLTIYRLPLNVIEGDGQELSDVEEIHHLHLLDWMKHLAYKKQDAETFSPDASAARLADFTAYCTRVKAEWERYKHKTRVVSYGGL